MALHAPVIHRPAGAPHLTPGPRAVPPENRTAWAVISPSTSSTGPSSAGPGASPAEPLSHRRPTWPPWRTSCPWPAGRMRASPPAPPATQAAGLRGQLSPLQDFSQADELALLLVHDKDNSQLICPLSSVADSGGGGTLRRPLLAEMVETCHGEFRKDFAGPIGRTLRPALADPLHPSAT